MINKFIKKIKLSKKGVCLTQSFILWLVVYPAVSRGRLCCVCWHCFWKSNSNPCETRLILCVEQKKALGEYWSKDSSKVLCACVKLPFAFFSREALVNASCHVRTLLSVSNIVERRQGRTLNSVQLISTALTSLLFTKQNTSRVQVPRGFSFDPDASNRSRRFETLTAGI